jgi:hypothetical protein
MKLSLSKILRALKGSILSYRELENSWAVISSKFVRLKEDRDGEAQEEHCMEYRWRGKQVRAKRSVYISGRI